MRQPRAQRSAALGMAVERRPVGAWLTADRRAFRITAKLADPAPVGLAMLLSGELPAPTSR